MTEIVIEAFEAPAGSLAAAWARQVPTLLARALARAKGLRPRLRLEARAMRPGEPRNGAIAWARGRVVAGAEVEIEVRVALGPAIDDEPALARVLRFPAGELLPRLEGLAAEVCAAIRREPPDAPDAPGALASTSPHAIRDYVRALDLTDEDDAPLEAPDRRRKLELLLLAVESDPAFAPARDALLEAALRAHEKGLRREARAALGLLSRLAPRDARAPYVLGELALLDARPDEETARAAFARALALDPGGPNGFAVGAAKRALERLPPAPPS